MSGFNLDNFGRRLASCRKAMGLQQSEICNILGCSNGAYSLYERSKRQPTLSVLFALTDQFGISLDFLFGCLTPFPNFFAERLKKIVTSDSNKSLKDFLETYELNEATSRLLLSGVCFPNSKVVNNLCEYFNCSADYLFGLSDISNPTQVNIQPITMSRDPFSDLTDEQRTVMETMLTAFRQQNAAAAKQQEA